MLTGRVSRSAIATPATVNRVYSQPLRQITAFIKYRINPVRLQRCHYLTQLANAIGNYYLLRSFASLMTSSATDFGHAM